MEIKNLRAIYLPDMEETTGPSLYHVVKSRDGLYWDPDCSNLPEGSDVSTAGFDLPFIDEDWLIMESVQEEDSNGNELFEMDVVELEGYYQKYFVIIRAGYSFVLFDGSNGILNDPEGKVWNSCKYVCPVWDAHKIDASINVRELIKTKF